jgi:hypothetical protein
MLETGAQHRVNPRRFPTSRRRKSGDATLEVDKTEVTLTASKVGCPAKLIHAHRAREIDEGAGQARDRDSAPRSVLDLEKPRRAMYPDPALSNAPRPRRADLEGHFVECVW